MDRNSTIGIDEIGDLARELERIKLDLRQIRGDITGLGADAFRAARTGVSEAAKVAANKGKATAELAEGQISAHPFLSVASAFTAGMLLGLRLSRKD
jgi:ElaB/YqjD/DUF883 family membrane-anchored ribosome-binding protein